MNSKAFKENVSSASCFQLSSHAFWPDKNMKQPMWWSITLWCLRSYGSTSWLLMFGGPLGESTGIFWLYFILFFSSYFHNSSGGKFKFYCYFVAGYGAAAIIIALLFFKFLAISYAFLAGAILLCLTCFIFAAIKIYEMTNVNMDFGNKRFAQEEQR